MNKIYTLGPHFSYSYNVARKIADEKETVVCVETINDVFAHVVSHKNTRGIVPIENMLIGTVRESLLALRQYPVCIHYACDLRIDHILAAQKKVYTKIVSHGQSLAQCSDFVRAHNGDVMEVSSTSAAMRMAAADDTIAAIGNKEAAEHYRVPIIKKKITDRTHNITRFIDIRHSYDICTTCGTKTSMIITPTEDRAGLLFEILSVFEIKGINLTKIESIPTGNKMNDYIFYIDIDGALDEKHVEDAIAFLRTFVAVDVFGSYSIDSI